jgi:hypothetical protein
MGPLSHMREQNMVSVLRDLGPRVTALARPRSNCMSKLQTHTLIREDATHQETRNYQTKNLEPNTKTDWSTDRRT